MCRTANYDTITTIVGHGASDIVRSQLAMNIAARTTAASLTATGQCPRRRSVSRPDAGATYPPLLRRFADGGV